MKNTQKGLTIPLLITIIAILVIGLGIYSYEEGRSNTASIPSNENQTTQWKSYENQANGIEFKYPESYALTSNTDLNDSILLSLEISPVPATGDSFTVVIEKGDISKYASCTDNLVLGNKTWKKCDSMGDTVPEQSYALEIQKNILLVVTRKYAGSDKNTQNPIGSIPQSTENTFLNSFIISASINSETTPTSATPVIQSITPTSGSTGTSATLVGSGFLATNTVLFGGGPVNNTSVTDNGTILTFTVPSSVGADCKPNEACPMYERLITPGAYTVSVRNVNGTSNSVSFEVK